MLKKLKKLTFKQLVDQNKAELLKNEKELAEIEKRIDNKHV
ncbi:FbpB family small basic protein [Pseudalkalibacillus hwajinpoensis]